MAFKFSLRSESDLVGVHVDLVSLARRALQVTRIDFVVTEGLRTQEKQAQMYQDGKSQTLRSRHLTGHAIDIFALPSPEGSWRMADYQIIADAFKQSSAELGIPVEWGAIGAR